MLPIMLQLYNVRNELTADFEGTLKEVAALGYRHVELAGLYGQTPARFREALDRAGLEAVSAHVPFREMTAAPERVIGDYRAIGCRYIAIPYLADEDRSAGPRYGEVKREIARLGGEVRKQGLVLLYHNHDFEFLRYGDKYALDDLYDSIPADLLQTEIDVCWTRVGGVDPAEYIRKYTGRAPVVHLKDFDSSQGGKITADYDLIGQAQKARREGAFPFRAVGYGVQDIPGIVRAAVDAGARWLVVEQDLPSPGKTPLECAGDSLNYLKGLG